MFSYYLAMMYVLVLVLLYVMPSQACKCLVRDRSTPEFLCDVDYVLRGEIEGETLIGNISQPMTRYRIYTTRVTDIYKGLDQIKNIIGGNTSYVMIKTAEQTPACGVQLPHGKDLVIAGYFKGMEIFNWRCSGWSSEWQKLPQSFQSFLNEKEALRCDSSKAPTTRNAVWVTSGLIFTSIFMSYM